MTRKLESLFDLPSSVSEDTVVTPESQPTFPVLPETLDALDKIEAALPAVRGLEASDQEMDELAAKATKEFDNLMDLGMQVDSRFASEIFSVASQMLGHAITAKTAKMNKKLKMIDLQLKAAKLAQTAKTEDDNGPQGLGDLTTDRNAILNLISQNLKNKDK